MFKLPISIVKNIISILPILMVVACGDSTSIKNIDMKPRSEMVTLAGAPAVASNSLSFPGVRADYRMTTTIDGILISNKTGSNADQLVDSKVDLIVFKDISINLRIAKLSAEIPSKDLISITELYIAYFNRVPDANGLTYWINEFKRGMSLDQMGESFYSAGLRYSLQTQYSADMSNVDFVKIIQECAWQNDSRPGGIGLLEQCRIERERNTRHISTNDACLSPYLPG
jgi:hypothetical protein